MTTIPTNTNTPNTPNTTNTRPGRQIRFWGSAARLVVGSGMLALAAFGSGGEGILDLAPGADLLVGLVLLPLIEVAVLASRGLSAPPLRLDGVAGHCINWTIGITAFVLVTQAALIFYGASILLAFVRGYAGCEIAAVSNWLRRRDDQIVCPVFSPIDQAEARRARLDPVS